MRNLYMQVLIDWALVDQCYGGSGQRFLRFNALRNVAKLFGVFLNEFQISKNKRKTKSKVKTNLFGLTTWSAVEYHFEMCFV